MFSSIHKILALAVSAVLLLSEGSQAWTMPKVNLPKTQKSNDLMAPLTTAAAVVAANIPQAVYAAAEVVDDYEYGKVDAPIGIAVAGGVVAILTAAVPVLLRPGEEALEEMRENEGYSFGSKDSSNTLNKR